MRDEKDEEGASGWVGRRRAVVSVKAAVRYLHWQLRPASWAEWWHRMLAALRILRDSGGR
ncbi:MAG: hypothetical protein ACRD1F_10040 [Terriglobales bacterium]